MAMLGTAAALPETSRTGDQQVAERTRLGQASTTEQLGKPGSGSTGGLGKPAFECMHACMLELMFIAMFTNY